MIRRYWFGPILMFIIFSWTGCSAIDGPAKGSDKDILSFGFYTDSNPGLSTDSIGAIDGDQITVTVPHGTDLTHLCAAFETTGAVVSVNGSTQVSGSGFTDFSIPVLYVVEAEDGSRREYTVSVESRTAKSMVDFRFTSLNAALDADVIGHISGDDIHFAVPDGISVTSLIATFSITGVSASVNGIVQDSGTSPHDFSVPVIYTVMASDGSTRDYTVTVDVELTEGSGFRSGSGIGDPETVILPDTAETFTMVLANDHASIAYPSGTGDSGTSTLTTRFWISETEITNAVAAAVLQWAADNGKFSSDTTAPNGLDAGAAEYGYQPLLLMGGSDCRISYDGSGQFLVDTGYEHYPATHFTWYGAVMICNWLTEMRDGNSAQTVYRWNDDSRRGGIAGDGIWQMEETEIDVDLNGYRLPTHVEWEYAARYRGTDPVNTVAGYADPYFTKGDSASGAVTAHNDSYDNNPANGFDDGKDACDQVAVYKYSFWGDVDGGGNIEDSGWTDEGTSSCAVVGSLTANSLGLYDMSGNVWEWVNDQRYSTRYAVGGSWYSASYNLRTGNRTSFDPVNGNAFLGFRLCRTADSF